MLQKWCDKKISSSLLMSLVLGQSVLLLSGCEFKLKPDPEPSPSAVPQKEELSERAKRARANSEILQEMFKVVFNEAAQNPAQFGNLLDSINQGASFEGIYNGLVYGDAYRKLETTARNAPPRALAIFSEELAKFAIDLPRAPQYDEHSFAELDADQAASRGIMALEYGKAQGNGSSPQPQTVESLRSKYTQVFIGAGAFRLKRVLGEVAIQVVGQNREYPQKMALWYAKWAVRMCAQGVDFGLPQRNQADEGFHFDWAVRAGEDRVKWEVLNRIHRLINATVNTTEN